MKTKRYILRVLLIAVLGSSQYACRDFLNVVPLDDLSGNNFWKDREDVMLFTRGVYNELRFALTNTLFFGATGDFRCGPALPSASGGFNGQHNYVIALADNNLNAVVNSNAWWNADDRFDFRAITDWRNFYEVIQLANILYEQVDEVESDDFPEHERLQVKAEAVFLRNLTYFFMTRIYGDIPYYTNAFNTDPLPRTNMIEVLKAGLDELAAVKEDLPWKYPDPSLRSVRASRGSLLALMMHMNMWAAAFDSQSARETYYRQTIALGDELLANPGAHRLLDIEDYTEIFEGKSLESLFEIPQSANYNEVFSAYATVGPLFLHFPNIAPANTYRTSALYFEQDFLELLYPTGGGADKRKDLWFDESMYESNGEFQFLKFLNSYSTSDGSETWIDDSQVVFRLSGLMLLEANAAANLGDAAKAIGLVNQVRERAGASPVEGLAGEDLLDFIFYERCRELMGEGHYFYDLVRTGKIMDPDYTEHPINVEDFRAGAWTWPIAESALNQNPEISLNEFWQ